MRLDTVIHGPLWPHRHGRRAVPGSGEERVHVAIGNLTTAELSNVKTTLVEMTHANAVQVHPDTEES